VVRILFACLFVSLHFGCDKPLARRDLKPFAKDATDIGWQYVEDGDLVTAEKRFKVALQYDADYAPAYFGLGYISSKREDLRQAIVHYRKALDLDPTIVNAWANLGTSLAISGQSDEARTAFVAALDLDPGNQYANCGMAQMLADKEKWNESAKYMRIAIKNGYTPDDEETKQYELHGAPILEGSN